MNKNDVKGAFKQAEGAVEDAYGQAAGDDSASLNGKADKAKGKILSLFGKVEDTVSSLATSAADEAQHLKTQIKEKPVQSTLVALAVGFILGKLIS